MDDSERALAAAAAAVDADHAAAACPAESPSLSADEIPRPMMKPTDRFSWCLSDTQTFALSELKKTLGNELSSPPGYWEDWRLCRFLRARDFDVADTAEMLRAHLAWRVAERLEDFETVIMPADRKATGFLNYYPGRIIPDADLDGMPVWMERLGATDARGMHTEFSGDAMVKMHVCVQERIERAQQVRAKELNRYPELCERGGISVTSMAGLGWAHATSRPGLETLRRIAELDEAHFPESLKALIVIDAPAAFHVGYKVCKPFINEVTLSKIYILSGSPQEFMPVLLRFIKKDRIPLCLSRDPAYAPCPLCTAATAAECTCLPGGGPIKPGSMTSSPALCSDPALAPAEEFSVGRRSAETKTMEVSSEHIGMFVVYEFEVADSYDINFTLLIDQNELVASSRVSGFVSSRVRVDKPGTVEMRFDNSFSMLRSKTIRKFRFFLMPDESKLAAELAASAAGSKKKKKKKKKKSATSAEAAASTSSGDAS